MTGQPQESSVNSTQQPHKDRTATTNDAQTDSGRIERRIYFMLKRVNRAIREFGLIQHRDRIAVAVSGGKDSLTLLRLLQAYQASRPEVIELIAVHVMVPDLPNSEKRARELGEHIHHLGLEFVAVHLPMSPGESWPLSCHRCAFNRRKALFSAADRAGCNKVALGHHADDSAQTTLLNLVHQGRLESIVPLREFFNGRITVIRPLILTPEKEISFFAREAGYPIGQMDCPNSGSSQRAEMARLLREIERNAPWVRSKLWQAVQRYSRTNA